VYVSDVILKIYSIVRSYSWVKKVIPKGIQMKGDSRNDDGVS